MRDRGKGIGWPRHTRTGKLWSTLACLLAVATAASAQDLTVSINIAGGGTLTGFHWTLEEDVTHAVTPGVVNPNPQSINFHKSYMPMVDQGSGTGNSLSLLNLDDTKRYFLTVLPLNEGLTAGGAPVSTGYTLGGVAIAQGQTTASLTVRPLPLPTAQISIQAFRDVAPLNNAYDAGEEGLAGWQVIVADGGGRYGMSGGHQMMDAFGNMLGTTYQYNVPGDAASGFLMVDGAPVVDMQGTGQIVTGSDGTVVLKNLAPGKYGIQLIPPPGQDWVQTTTIEGTKTIDAWVKANEPVLMVEFGMAGVHVFMGFVPHFVDATALNGTTTVTGQVVNFHMARPPNVSDSMGGAPFPSAVVGLNDPNGNALCVIDADPETGMFSIPNVPPGTYQLVVWDKNLDMVIQFASVTVPADTPTVDMGQVAVNDWFGHLWNYVYYDANGNGFPDNGEVGMPDQNINIRFRDGSVFQAMATDSMGWAPFDEVFPFFDWLVAEVDYLRFKATGMTAVVDHGGTVNTLDEAFPGYGRLNPQLQPENGNLPYRTEVGPTLTQGFQLFAGQTNVLYWGKSAYVPPENGGISGIVFYDPTRAESDPRFAVGEPWAPGVARVPLCLYEDDNADGAIDDLNAPAGVQLCDVDNYPFGWSEGGAMGAEDVKRNGTGTVFSLGDALQQVYTDSWDDAAPENCPGMDPADPILTTFPGLDPTKCFDGMRSWNQVRPAVFDGGYAFNDLTSGTYIVEVIPPRGYEVYKEEDKNVDFGESYEPSTQLLPPVCVGDAHVVPAELTLFPGVPADFAGESRPLCDRKQLRLNGGANAAADFFLLTKAPIAAHFTGLINNDLANQFDPATPNFGEKPSAAFIPVSLRDWTGTEIVRVYSDQYGVYNGLVPSTYTANVPNPSGYSPAMYSVCINDWGPVPDGAGGYMTDPFALLQFSEACYTMQFMPGTTTYLDTPVLPISAFASQPVFPLDCQQPDLAPVIRQVTTDASASGPYVAANSGVRTVTIAAVGDLVVSNPAYDGDGVPPKTITRHYGFGADQGTVTLDGVALPISSWSDSSITVDVDTATLTTGQLLVTTQSGVTSPYGITLHVGTPSNNDPIVVTTTIQAAIDQAVDGDLVLVPPGLYNEVPILYKDIILQGAGAHATVLMARTTPTEKLLQWRAKMETIIAGGDFLLPGQNPVGNPLLTQGPLATEQGAGVTVLNQQATPFNYAQIDGLKIMGAHNGGGIFVNAYASGVTISNNYITANDGTLGGGIRVGNLPGQTVFAGMTEVDSMNDNVTIKYNLVAGNGNINGAGGGAGGIGLYTGSDNYIVSDNFICGNFTQGSGGGIGQIGFSDGGQILRNKVVFNQSFHVTPSWGEGGGIAIMGLMPEPGAVQPYTLGTGDTTISYNLIQGNYSGTGDGGGIRLAFVNGRDVELNPLDSTQWNSVTIDHNVITNNVSAKGGAVSLLDAAKVSLTLNTIAQNDSTSTAGEVISNSPWPGPTDPAAAHSLRLPSGILSRAHSPLLAGLMADSGGVGPEYAAYSNPEIDANILWRNRSFAFDITINYPYGGLYPMFDPLNPGSFTGYWDVGVVPDTAGTLNPTNGILTDATGYDPSNSTTDPGFASAYFNQDAAKVLVDPLLQTPFLAAIALNEGGNSIQIAYYPLSLTGDYTDTLPGVVGALGGTTGGGSTGGGSTGGGSTGGGSTGGGEQAPASAKAAGGCFLNTLFGEE